MNAQTLVYAGTALVMLGFILVLAGIILPSGGSKTEVRGGGVVFLGPIPLIFGTDKKSAVTVSIIALILMLLYFWFFRK
jgi:uncharacterized protein (TIGR00304 family)